MRPKNETSFYKKKYPKEHIRVDKEKDPIFYTFMEVIIISTAENLSNERDFCHFAF